MTENIPKYRRAQSVWLLGSYQHMAEKYHYHMSQTPDNVFTLLSAQYS